MINIDRIKRSSQVVSEEVKTILRISQTQFRENLYVKRGSGKQVMFTIKQT